MMRGGTVTHNHVSGVDGSGLADWSRGAGNRRRNVGIFVASGSFSFTTAVATSAVEVLLAHGGRRGLKPIDPLEMRVAKNWQMKSRRQLGMNDYLKSLVG